MLADSEQDISHISNWSAASGRARADTDPLFSAPELGQFCAGRAQPSASFPTLLLKSLCAALWLKYFNSYSDLGRKYSVDPIHVLYIPIFNSFQCS